MSSQEDSELDLVERLTEVIREGADGDSIRAINELVDRGVDLNAWDAAALWHATSRSSSVVLEYLFTCGATLEAHTFMMESPLHQAARKGRLDMIHCLLRHAVIGDLHRLNELGRTALGEAVIAGHANLARALLEAGTGADFCLHDHAVDTPLRYAVDDGRADLVALLLEFGASPDQRGWMWVTPRDAATEMKDTHPEIFAMIDRIPRIESPV